jgi:hypothetical protein
VKASQSRTFRAPAGVCLSSMVFAAQAAMSADVLDAPTHGRGHCLDSPGWSALGRVGWLAWALARLTEAEAECDGVGSMPGDAGPRLPAGRNAADIAA